jgi:hypothetical protein
MRKIIATLLLIFWPGVFMTPARAQQALFFSMNVRPAASGGGGGQKFVNSGTFTGTVNGEQLTSTLGWTVTPGNFLIVGVAASSSSVAGITASGTAMTSTTGSGELAIFILPNAPAATQITMNFISRNGAGIVYAVAEFSGLSSTATGQGTDSAIFNSNLSLDAWTNNSYTNPTTGSLVVIFAETFNNTQPITSQITTAPWVLGASSTSGSGSNNIFLAYQLNAPTGSYTGTGGTLPTGSFGGVYATTYGYK